jgi:hypothetical protein
VARLTRLVSFDYLEIWCSVSLANNCCSQDMEAGYRGHAGDTSSRLETYGTEAEVLEWVSQVEVVIVPCG